jgi:hypothetical protein
MTSSDKFFNPLAATQSISPPSSVPSPGDLKQSEYEKMAGSLMNDNLFGTPKINVTKRNDFKMPDINLEYIKPRSSSFDNVDEFSE